MVLLEPDITRLNHMRVEFFGIGAVVFLLQVANLLSWRQAAAYGVGCAWLPFSAEPSSKVLDSEFKQQRDDLTHNCRMGDAAR